MSSDDPRVLDDAYDRLGRWGFDEPGGYVNHGPMACEALDALGRSDQVDGWSRLDDGTPPVEPVAPIGFVWQDSLGDVTRAGEWMGLFAGAVADDGPEGVLAEWLPRLLPAMGVALFHGAIRTAHAARAVTEVDTPARRAELVRALGYWAALWAPGPPVDGAGVAPVDDVRRAIVEAAADGARRYVARPNIINLHGVTAAMAVALLVEHTDEDAARTALAQVHAEHAALYDGVEAATVDAAPDVTATSLVDAAVASGEAHAVKLVEAGRRGWAATGDPAFLAASERVVRRGRRALERDS